MLLLVVVYIRIIVSIGVHLLLKFLFFIDFCVGYYLIGVLIFVGVNYDFYDFIWLGDYVPGYLIYPGKDKFILIIQGVRL
nr:MAG TPA: hypothetical protein [Caudoviricetes sp.]